MRPLVKVSALHSNLSVSPTSSFLALTLRVRFCILLSAMARAELWAAALPACGWDPDPRTGCSSLAPALSSHREFPKGTPPSGASKREDPLWLDMRCVCPALSCPAPFPSWMGSPNPGMGSPNRTPKSPNTIPQSPNGIPKSPNGTPKSLNGIPQSPNPQMGSPSLALTHFSMP